MVGRAGRDWSFGNSRTDWCGPVVMNFAAGGHVSRAGRGWLGVVSLEAVDDSATDGKVVTVRECEPVLRALLTCGSAGGRLRNARSGTESDPLEAEPAGGESCRAIQPQANASSSSGKAKGRIVDGNFNTVGSASLHFEDDAVHMKVHRPFLHRPQHLRRGIAKSHKVHRLEPRAETNREPIGTGLAD